MNTPDVNPGGLRGCRGAESRNITNTHNTSFVSDSHDVQLQQNNNINILEEWEQPCILGRSSAVRPVWTPRRGQGSPLICHPNCWCQTSRVSVSGDLSLSAFTHARSTWLAAYTADLVSLSVVMATTFLVPLQSWNRSLNLMLQQPEILSVCHLQGAHTRRPALYVNHWPK